MELDRPHRYIISVASTIMCSIMRKKLNWYSNTISNYIWTKTINYSEILRAYLNLILEIDLFLNRQFKLIFANLVLLHWLFPLPLTNKLGRNFFSQCIYFEGSLSITFKMMKCFGKRSGETGTSSFLLLFSRKYTLSEIQHCPKVFCYNEMIYLVQYF